ncbi:MAG: hypothetical protein J0L62_10740 [Bacteroidetes bacterium]|nr:hypothetical protein [Bacteroidota bacterium]
MNKWLTTLALAGLAFSCDSPDVPNYNTEIKTDRTEYTVGDTVKVSIVNDLDQAIYISIDGTDSSKVDYQLQQKTVENWKTVVASHPVPSGKVFSLNSGNKLLYKFVVPAVPVGGVNIFRVNHRIYMNQDMTKSIGGQQTTSNSFFVYE